MINVFEDNGGRRKEEGGKNNLNSFVECFRNWEVKWCDICCFFDMFMDCELNKGLDNIGDKKIRIKK